MPPRRCLECGALTTGSRCPTHRAAQRAKYGGDWRTRSRETIAAYRALHGDTCPGWATPPHPIDANEWTTDHHVGPLCRRCNSRKRAMNDRHG